MVGAVQDRLDRLLGYTHMGLKESDLPSVVKALRATKFATSPEAETVLHEPEP